MQYNMTIILLKKEELVKNIKSSKVIYVFIFVFIFNQGCEMSSLSGDNKSEVTNIDEIVPFSEDGGQDNYFYFSYDDSASTVGVELTKNSLENNQLPQKEWSRTWEFLNFEDFPQLETVVIDDKFSINMGLWKQPDNNVYEFGVYLATPELGLEDRDNAVITLLLDVSGSMGSTFPFNSGQSEITSLLDIAKLGMKYMVDSLKPGDIVNIVTFSTDTEIIMEGWEYSESSEPAYKTTIDSLDTIGGTDLSTGIQEAYRVAQANFDSNKINRVIILTDAIANQGEVDPTIISDYTEINNMEGIYFSGLGIGPDFQESFLNELTEAGKGGYFAIVTPYDIKRAFQSRFMSLLNVAAKDVLFRLDYPSNFLHINSASEEQSTNEQDVQKTNFSYNTSQFFLEEFSFEDDIETALDEEFTLTITYKNPIDYSSKETSYTLTISDLLGNMDNSIKDAFLVSLLPRLIRNELTLDEGDTILDMLTTYHSDLANEYKVLIKRWIMLSR